MMNLGGTIRECLPSETLAKLRPLLFPIFGITRIADITGLDHLGIPVAICIRPNSKLLSTSQGKAFNKELAQISAIMESIEAWHAENISEATLFASYNQMQREHLVPELNLLLKSTICYENVSDIKVAWIKAKNLIDDQDFYLPYAYYCLDSTRDDGCHGLFPSNSNGLAAGNSYDEALCHALFELIERDCIHDITQLTPLELYPRRVKLDSIDSPNNKLLIERIHKEGLEIYIWDITNKYKVSTFTVEINDSKLVRHLGRFVGYGTHLSKEVALSRAITEAIQCRLTLISGSRDDLMPSLYKNNQNRFTKYSLQENLDYKLCHDDSLPSTFKACVKLLIDKLKDQQISQIIVFDHTREEIGIPVVHVIAPELKHNWRLHRMTV
jgi:ribosomal protein S12 methylthiotransferase accessory factor